MLLESDVDVYGYRPNGCEDKIKVKKKENWKEINQDTETSDRYKITQRQ